MAWRLPRASVILWMLCLCTDGPSRGHASEPGPAAEYLLKTAFLYNVAKFVEWPEDTSAPPGTPLTLCMTGNAFGATIESLAGKPVQGRPLMIRTRPDKETQGTCDILFIEFKEPAQIAAMLDPIKDRPILTVCDQPSCAQQGIMVNLQRQHDKINIELNLEAAQRARLKFSSQLIKLAHVVGAKP